MSQMSGSVRADSSCKDRVEHSWCCKRVRWTAKVNGALHSKADSCHRLCIAAEPLSCLCFILTSSIVHTGENQVAGERHFNVRKAQLLTGAAVGGITLASCAAAALAWGDVNAPVFGIEHAFWVLMSCAAAGALYGLQKNTRSARRWILDQSLLQ